MAPLLDVFGGMILGESLEEATMRREAARRRHLRPSSVSMTIAHSTSTSTTTTGSTTKLASASQNMMPPNSHPLGRQFNGDEIEIRSQVAVQRYEMQCRIVRVAAALVLWAMALLLWRVTQRGRRAKAKAMAMGCTTATTEHESTSSRSSSRCSHRQQQFQRTQHRYG